MLEDFKVIESLAMVEDGDPYTVRRSWRERLFSSPWRPLQATRVVIPQVPKREALRYGRTLVMHPAMAAELRQKLKSSNAAVHGRGPLK